MSLGLNNFGNQSVDLDNLENIVSLSLRVDS